MSLDVRQPTRVGRILKILRSAMLLVLAAGCLPQTAHASGTLFVGLYEGKKVVKFRVGRNTFPPGPTDVASAFSAPQGIAVHGPDLFFYDKATVNGLARDVIRRTPLNPPSGIPVTAVTYGDANGHTAAAMAADNQGRLYFVGGTGWGINRLVSQGATSQVVATGPGPGCGIVFDGVDKIYSTHQEYGHPNSKNAIHRFDIVAGTANAASTVLVPSGATNPDAATNPVLRKPCAMAIDRQGWLYVGDLRTTAAGLETIIWKLNPKASNPGATMGVYSVVGAQNQVDGLTIDDAGNLYATVGAEHKLFKIDTSGNSALFHSFANACQQVQGGGPVGCHPWGLAFVPDPVSLGPLQWLQVSWRDVLKWLFAAGGLLVIVWGVVTIRRRRRD